MHEDRIGVVVLAAGASRRMGTPKQLLDWWGQPLIRHTTESALAAGGDPVVVVLGAHASAIQPALDGMEVLNTCNAEWDAGMGGTVACGVAALLQTAPNVAGVLLMTVDQPCVTSGSLRRLIDAGVSSEHQLAAARYGETVGAPAYFGRDYFSELLQLAGTPGARGLLKQHAAGLRIFDLPEAAFDLDTWEDYLALRGRAILRTMS